MKTFRLSLKNHTSKTSTLLILDREEICEISVIKKKRRKRFLFKKNIYLTTQKGTIMEYVMQIYKKKFEKENIGKIIREIKGRTIHFKEFVI